MNTSNLMANSKRVAHIKSIKGINPLSTKMRNLKKKSTDRAKRANKIILLTLKKYSTTKSAQTTWIQLCSNAHYIDREKWTEKNSVHLKHLKSNLRNKVF